jgi:O-succinylbenzoic acid--CoA ligase
MSNTIPCPLHAAAKDVGNLPAIIVGNRAISYRRYEQMVASVSARLDGMGLGAKGRIAVISNNSWEYVILLLAVLRLGCVICPISPRFPQKAILSVLRKIDCGIVIDPLHILAQEPLPDIRTIEHDALFKEDPSQGRNATHGISVDLDVEATIVLTSGTSGAPKAALHTIGNHYYSAIGSNENIPVRPGDRWLLSLPLYHVGGLGIVFRMLLARGVVVIHQGKERIEDVVNRYKITHLSLVSTQLYRWLAEGVSEKATAGLKALLVGGGPVPPSLVQSARQAGLPLYTTYGLTEMASQVTTTAPNDTPEHLLTSGRLLSHREIKIEAGEILVKGKTLFKGYLKGNQITLPVDRNGWFPTGDLGCLTQDGYLTLLGRRDNCFISSGENICPEEIERCLCLLPQIAQAVVVPIEDKEYGFRPVAFIRTQAGRPVDKKALTAHLERHLPRFKIPEAFYQWPHEVDRNKLKLDRRYFTERSHSLKKECIN